MIIPQHKNHCPVFCEINNFGIPFSLLVLNLGTEKKILIEIMHYHYMTYMTTL